MECANYFFCKFTELKRFRPFRYRGGVRYTGSYGGKVGGVASDLETCLVETSMIRLLIHSTIDQITK